MTTALEQFERALVKASGELHERTPAPPARTSQAPTSAPSPGTPARRRRRLIRRVRQLNAGLQFGLAVSTVSALAAGGAYVLLSGERTKTIASLECQLTPKSAAIVDTVTGDPVVDCAASWPSATGGRSAAPPLAAWESDDGTKAAVVRPAAWGAPDASFGGGWRRLPAGWTVNLSVVELNDQLNDISSGLSGGAMGPSGGQACTYAQADARTVRLLLHADGLDSWNVRIRPSDQGATVSRDCRETVPDIAGSAHVVTLIQLGPIKHVNQTPQQRKLIAATIAANRALAKLDARVNDTLARRCASVSSAAALWTAQARAAGFRPTTLAYYRALNATPRPAPRLFNYYYTLITQPASQHTGACAHVLVMGAGDLRVYVARITPPGFAR